MKQFTVMLRFLLVLWVSCAGGVWASNAGVAIIVNQNNNNQLDEAEVRRIFLGKSRAFPDGSDVRPLDLSSGSEVRSLFISKVLKKSEGNLNAYWARMLFSSKATPPKVISKQEDVKKLVAENAQMIGYIDAALVDDSVRVLMVIP